ncbi:translation factor GTPase family protein [Lentzea sp. NPDC042327]|uniref:translation factor GTPase family protein n=1 Tax=Lentzea sp. NPDC042327 TaxID=3154801 RepID=UPI0033CF5897
MSRTLNLGVLAHVDAGKTSLTERLLHTAGVIDALGSVDAGNTQTDSLALERQRGITIKSAVASFAVGDVVVNLIDTPGHPDFIAEVERVLDVLDRAVLVVSAVEGVQAQTRVLMRTLQRLEIPTVVFVNKMDRRGADGDRVAREVAQELATDAPIFFGSAITGDGVAELVAAVTSSVPDDDAAGGPLSGTVFKVERGKAGEKVAFVRLFSGTVRVRERVRIGDREGKVTSIAVFDRGSAPRRATAVAGQIAKLWGLDVRIGDTIGTAHRDRVRHFAPPTLETVVEADDRVALHSALHQLAEQDPLINLRLDGDDVVVSLYGEVQKEVIEATLALEHGVAVRFRDTRTIRVERPRGTGEAVRVLGESPYAATIGFRVAPGPEEFRLEVELGSLPLAFFRATEEAVRDALRADRVHGCTVTMTHSGYCSPVSVAGDFRSLAPIVLREALERAGTVTCEPVHRFRLEVPPDALAAVLVALGKVGGVPLTTTATVLEGHLPAARVHELQRRLPALTRGEGVLESEFDHYA